MASIIQRTRDFYNSLASKARNYSNQYIEHVARPLAVGVPQVQQGVKNVANYFNPIDQNKYVDWFFNKASNIPRYTLPQRLPGNLLPTNTPNRPINFISTLGRGMIESTLNIPRNLVTGSARLQKEQLNLLRGKGYNFQNALAGTGNLVEAGLDLSTLGIGKSLVKGGAKELLKTGAWNAIKSGAKQGAGYGAIGGASYGVGNQYDRKFDLGEVVFGAGAGALLGGALGGGLAGIGTIARQTEYSPRLIEQLRDLKGRWTKGKTLIKPALMPKVQFDFQVKVNNKLGRNPYEPVYPSDLQQAIDLGLSVRTKGGNKAILEAETTRGNLLRKGSSLAISKEGVTLSPSTRGLADLSSTSIIPEKGRLNVSNLNLSETGQKVVRASNQVPVTVIGNKDVIKASKLTSGARAPMSDVTQQELLAKRLNSRQAVVSLTREFEALKKSGADEKTLIAKFNQISDQSRIAQQEGTFAGRQLQAQNILADELATPQQKVLALLDNAGIDKSKYAKDAVKVDWNNGAAVVAFYRKYVPPKFSEFLTEFRYSNMLSSPLTHIVNISTNLFQSGVVAPVEKTITGGLDLIKSAMTGAERKYYMSDGIKYAQGFYKSLPQAWKKFSATISGKEINIKPDMERVPTSTGGLFGAYTTPLRALEAADQFFMEMVKGGEATSLQGRGLGATEIGLRAENSARYRLFRQKFDPTGELGQGYLLRTWDNYNSIVNQLRRLPGGNWIVPFLQTPTNILKQGVEYSPLGVTTMVGAKRPIEQLSKAIIGSTVFAGTYGLLNKMEFTWEVPNGQKERDYFYAANMQPYSVKIGDKWVSYSKLGPLAYPIAMAAALRYAEKYRLGTEKESAISTAIGGMLKFFSDQSYVKQLGDFIDSIQTGKGIVGGLKMEASNAVSQLIPWRSFMGWLSRMIDPVQRKSNTFMSSITSQIPFASKLNEPYYNPITGGESMRSNRFLNSFSPVRMTTGDTRAENMYKYTGSAKRAYANLKALPKEEARAMWDKIVQASPEIARGIKKLIKEEELGLTASDKAIQNLGVENGERAYKIVQEFNKLKTPEEKRALWQKYVDAKIITKDVAKQVKELLNQ